MSNRLLLLRHAKSAWDTNAPSDFERPLSGRGRRDAPRIGHWLSERPELRPQIIVASPAERTRETATLVLEAMGMDTGGISWDRRLYGASPGELIGIARELPYSTACAMLVGHNPGMESLLRVLCPGAETPAGGKLFPTATLACIRITCGFADLEPGAGSLETIIRPRDL